MMMASLVDTCLSIFFIHLCSCIDLFLLFYLIRYFYLWSHSMVIGICACACVRAHCLYAHNAWVMHVVVRDLTNRLTQNLSLCHFWMRFTLLLSPSIVSVDFFTIAARSLFIILANFNFQHLNFDVKSVGKLKTIYWNWTANKIGDRSVWFSAYSCLYVRSILVVHMHHHHHQHLIYLLVDWCT